MKLILNVSFFLSLILLISCGSQKGSSEEEQAWNETQQKNTLSAYDSFLADYPDTKKKDEVAQRREASLFGMATLDKTEYYLRKYLQEFPQGKRKKEVENELKKLEKSSVSPDEAISKTYVGSVRYLDGSSPDMEIFSVTISDLEDLGDEMKCKITVLLSSDVKKVMEGKIQKSKMSIKFVEDESEDFLLELPEGRFYKKDNNIYIESVDPSQKVYWILK